ncbi:MAG: hypothetical protein IIA45_08375 [Bacteroidetes bacterium]|nr:hypothetical protein [Bacteroidota bacterium]
MINQLPTVLLSVCTYALVVVLAHPASAQEFSSTYSEVTGTNCKYLDELYPEEEFGDGADIPSICEGMGVYNVYIYYDFYGNDILSIIEGRGEEEEWFTDMFVEGCEDSQMYGGKLEWRLVDEKPYACIIRFTCLEMRERTDEETGNIYEIFEQTSEYLLVRGLEGYDKIKFDVDVKITRKANEQARILADEAYMKFYN